MLEEADKEVLWVVRTFTDLRLSVWTDQERFRCAAETEKKHTQTHTGKHKDGIVANE